MANGPKLTVTVDARCDGCDHHSAEYYCVEDGNDCDSGFDHYCSHSGEKKHTGSSSSTPSWCPLMPKKEPHDR